MGLVLGTLFTHLTRLGIVFKVYVYSVYPNCNVYTDIWMEKKPRTKLAIFLKKFHQFSYDTYIPTYLHAKKIYFPEVRDRYGINMLN